MSGGSIAALVGVVNNIELSGSLTKTAAPSSTNVTSDTITVRVPIGNGGTLNFKSFSITGTVTTQYSKNGAAFAALAENDGLTFANGDTLALRGNSMTAGEAWTFTVQDNTKAVNIGTYTITAS